MFESALRIYIVSSVGYENDDEKANDMNGKPGTY